MSTTAAAQDYTGASSQAIEHHYSLSNDFYRLWLDESMTYSCALFGEGDDLEAAQKRKLDYLIDGANAAGAARVLDIGCGWGSLLERLTQVHDVQHVVGLTLSGEQAEVAAERGGERAEVRVENWADHQPGEPYDAIISIGAFEHFARFGLPRDERVAGYRQFFKSCREWLPLGGRLALQTNAKGSNVRLDRQTAQDLRFIADTIFPESELPWLSEIAEASEKMFNVVSVRNDAPHYARTCAEWHERFMSNRERCLELVGEHAVADYERYLSTTVGHFEAGNLALLRIVFERAT